MFVSSVTTPKKKQVSAVFTDLNFYYVLLSDLVSLINTSFTEEAKRISQKYNLMT